MDKPEKQPDTLAPDAYVCARCNGSYVVTTRGLHCRSCRRQQTSMSGALTLEPPGTRRS